MPSEYMVGTELAEVLHRDVSKELLDDHSGRTNCTSELGPARDLSRDCTTFGRRGGADAPLSHDGGQDQCRGYRVDAHFECTRAADDHSRSLAVLRGNGAQEERTFHRTS